LQWNVVNSVNLQNVLNYEFKVADWSACTFDDVN
jgi:hypothetical protein